MTAYAINYVNQHATQDSPFRNQVVIERKIPKQDLSNSTGEKLYSLLKSKVEGYTEKSKTLLNNKDGLLKKIIYPSSMIKDDIITNTKNMFGYTINDIHESSLVDDEGTFKIYTAVLELEDRDYSKLLNDEWEVSESLGLYDKNIILRFL